MKNTPDVHVESKCTSTCCNDWDVEYPMQSDIQQSHSENNNTTDATNVSFDDELPGEVINIPSAIETENPYIPSAVDLAKFLNRPVLIKNYSWVLGSQTNDSFDPWNLYFNHTSIKKKVDNYYLLRCKLKLKFVINASPFHYGVMLAAYKPLQKFLTPAIIDTTLGSSDFCNVGFSQLPRVYVYPQTSQGGEMSLPFLYPKEWLDVTSASELTNMGTVHFRPLTTLQFANAGVGVNCNIQVFAWAEDVVISGPTVKLAMQSSSDEYGSVSGPASAVANIAGMLEGAPVIGKFATATRMAASTVSGIAKFFGFTNVPVIADVHAFTPNPFPQFASPEIGTAIEKLTLDPKNELTIDPKSVGVDVGDELLITSFTERESYLTQFPWAMSDAPDKVLFSTQISPFMERIEAGVSQTLINMTPLSLVARMFAYWRGDIKLRLKFNCSQYHKGRVRISWDPVGDIGATVDSTTEVYTKIVDLAKCTDIDINIPYMQTTAFLNSITTFANRYANDGSQTNSAGATNGVLTVRVLTDLSSPLSTADIQCIVFVRGSENLEFANPTNIDGTHTLCAYPVQSSMENYDIEQSVTEMGDSPSNPPSHSYVVYQGEVVKSIRTLIRRTAMHGFFPLPDSSASTAAGTTSFARLSRYPYYPGFNANALTNANKLLVVGTQYFNYVQWHPLTWVSQCFLGCRGAINYRVNTNRSADTVNLRVLRTNSYTNDPMTKALQSSFAATSATQTQPRLTLQYHNDTSGVSVTNTKTNTGLNVSIPYYSKYKFRTTSATYTILGNSADDSNLDWYQAMVDVNPTAEGGTNLKNAGFQIYMGAGTDYSPIFFVNVPTLYLYASLPTTV